MAATVGEKQRPSLTNPLLSTSSKMTSHFKMATGSAALTSSTHGQTKALLLSSKLRGGAKSEMKGEGRGKGGEANDTRLSNRLLSGTDSHLSLSSKMKLTSATTASSFKLTSPRGSLVGKTDLSPAAAKTSLTPLSTHSLSLMSKSSTLTSGPKLYSQLQLQTTGSLSSVSTRATQTKVPSLSTSMKLSSALTSSSKRMPTTSSSRKLEGLTTMARARPLVTDKATPTITTTRPDLSSPLMKKPAVGRSMESNLLSSKLATPPFSTQSSILSNTSQESRQAVTPHLPDHEEGRVKTVPLHSKVLPVYDFSSTHPAASSSKGPQFLPPELDASVQVVPTSPVVDTVRLKVAMINSVATSLLSSPDFGDPKNPTRRNLKKLGGQVSQVDPEFVLKLALYTRRSLNIRTTANFLTALAASLQDCRPFLKKYFSASIRLPSDWIEVAEIYQSFHDKGLNFGSLPTALRKVMATKFPGFDSYQLAKYNKDSSKKKSKKVKGREATRRPVQRTGRRSRSPSHSRSRSRSPSSTDSDSESSDSSVVHDEESETEEELVRMTFTLKQLVRKLHIADPVEHVMCLVGKRYPDDPESFRRSHLPGVWDQDRAGKRMKLPTPETWETQVSLKGNKAAVWEELIDHRKLPFMAMLRNLRNLIIAGVSPKHHQWVLNKLSDERAVVNSQQFPFRFFSAYEVLGNLEKLGSEENSQKVQKPTKVSKKPRKPPRKPKEIPKIDPHLLKRYRSALDTALKIATCYNVKPISGSTVILCNAGRSMNRPCTSARGLGKPRTVLEVGVLLGLMCKYSCEQCTLAIYGSQSYTEVDLEEGTILHNMELVLKQVTEKGLDEENGSVPPEFLRSLIVDRVQIDNLVLLTDAMSMETEEGRGLLNFLDKYRHLVNPNLLFVSVDLSGRAVGVSDTITPHHENDIHLAGYSDQILRFIAERGDSGQLTYVDNIDKAHNLAEVKQSCLQGAEVGMQESGLGREKAMLAATPQRKWRTVRVFISSTFRDMHGERDLLTRFVFPELRSRCLHQNINLYEVDLRWGVTETDARSHKAIEICLTEISRCQYFIGLLGHRYGWAPEVYQVPDSPDYDWVRDYPPGRSITELEMYHAALCDVDKAVGKAFFYFRDASVNREIPEDMKEEFVSDSHESEEKIEDLKSAIRTSGLEVYDGYPSKWIGVVEEKPMLGGLEDFGQRVLHNLWNAIQRDYPESEVVEDPIEVAAGLHDAFAESRASTFVGRQALLKKASELIGSGNFNLVVVAGKPGSGKSAFMAALAQFCMENAVCSSDGLLTHFIGAAPGSSNIASALTRLCLELKRRFSLSLPVPEDYPDLAKEWVEFLSESSHRPGVSSGGPKLVIFIDALDLLEDSHNGRSLHWLPAILPEGGVLVTSVVEGGNCLKILRQRKPAPVEVTVGGLDMFDKAEMVRRKLSRHRKALDESPFNNQMKLLLSKRDANNPLYLHLACEELRMFGVFEEVSSYIRKMPAAMSTLLLEVLGRLETEHGVELLSTSLALLCLVRSGLKEYELAGALSSYFSADEDAGKLPPVLLARLLRSLQTFLQPTSQDNSDLLSIAHKDIENAVRARYMRGAVAGREKKFHAHLASYFRAQADPSHDGSFKGNDARAFSELPYHLMAAGAWKELEELLCDLRFVVAKCHLGMAQQLLEDFTPSAHGLAAAKAREVRPLVHLPRVKTFKSFVSRNLHVLTATPALTLQQAVNEPQESTVAQHAQRMLKENPMPVMRWVNRPQDVNPCHMVLAGRGGAVTAVCVSHDGRMFATGSKSCVVKLFEVETGREVHTFLGHAGMITSLCFVGESALCSASQDCTLSLWSVREGHRVAVMKSHTRGVRGCVANQSGKSIVSVAWDASIKVWDGSDGSLKSTLKTQGRNCPINCVAFHPEGQLVAVGSWDSTVKIWDTLNVKRLKVLKGHKTSVQACAYAPSGRHIVSAALDGEVRVWAVKSAAAVGTITGHSAPVNAICFTPNGQYLATASSDKQIKVWSGSLGQPAQVMSEGKEHGYAHSLSFDHDTQSVSVGYHDGSVCKYNMHTGVMLCSHRPHTAAVKALAYYDGLCMTASADATVKVWCDSSLPQCVSLDGHSSPLTTAVWNKHGLASASEDLSILVWPHSPSTYKKLLKNKSKSRLTVKPLATLHGHTGSISGIAFSPTGGTMVTVSHDKSIIVWDTLSYKPTQTIPVAHKDWINTCAFSDLSGDYLVTGSNDFTLKVWDMKSGKEKTTLRGHTSGVTCVAFSTGCIISGAVDGSVKVWSQKGVEITTLYCHGQRINACFLNIPGKFDKNLQQSWADLVEGEEEEGESIRPKWSLDQVSVVTVSDDGTASVWRPFLPNHISTLKGHSDRVVSLSSTLNNNFISASLDGSARLWNPPLPSQPGTLIPRGTIDGHVGAVTDVATASDCISSTSGDTVTFAATSGRDGTFVVWGIHQPEDGEKRAELVLEKLYQVKSCEKALSSIAVTAKSGIIVGKNTGEIEIWRFSSSNYPTLDVRRSGDQLAGDAPVSKLVVTPDKKYLVAGSWSNQVFTLSGSNKTVASRMQEHKDWVVGVCASQQDSKTVVYSISLDKTLAEWPLVTPTQKGRQPRVATPTASIHRLHLEVEGEKEQPWPLAVCDLTSSHLVISDSSGRILVWCKTSKQIVLTKKIHQSAINSLATIDGSLVTGSDDSTVKVWKLECARTGVVHLKQIGHFYCQSCVTAIAVSRAAKRGRPLLLVGDSLGHVILLEWHQ